MCQSRPVFFSLKQTVNGTERGSAGSISSEVVVGQLTRRYRARFCAAYIARMHTAVAGNATLDLAALSHTTIV